MYVAGFTSDSAVAYPSMTLMERDWHVIIGMGHGDSRSAAAAIVLSVHSD